MANLRLHSEEKTNCSWEDGENTFRIFFAWGGKSQSCDEVDYILNSFLNRN